MRFDFDFTKKNVGNTDRIIRAVLGVLLIIGAARSSSWVGGLIGAVLLGTAYLRFCPFYSTFDYSTLKDEGSVNKDDPSVIKDSIGVIKEQIPTVK
jgi:hypothetical protein